MFSSLVLFTVASALLAVNAEPNKTKWTNFPCRPTGVFTPNDDRMAEVKACGEGQCSFGCNAEALGLVHGNGTTSLEIYNEWVDTTFPQQHKQLAKTWFGDCYVKFGQHIDINDKDCVMSKKYLKCTWDIVPSMKCTPEA